MIRHPPSVATSTRTHTRTHTRTVSVPPLVFFRRAVRHSHRTRARATPSRIGIAVSRYYEGKTPIVQLGHVDLDVILSGSALHPLAALIPDHRTHRAERRPIGLPPVSRLETLAPRG